MRIFFENFAPPVPEKKLRNGNTNAGQTGGWATPAVLTVQSGIGTTTDQLAGDSRLRIRLLTVVTGIGDPAGFGAKGVCCGLRARGHGAVVVPAKSLKNVLLCRRSLLQESAIPNLGWKYATL
jgi:hypothetical protein